MQQGKQLAGIPAVRARWPGSSGPIISLSPAMPIMTLSPCICPKYRILWLTQNGNKLQGAPYKLIIIWDIMMHSTITLTERFFFHRTITLTLSLHPLCIWNIRKESPYGRISEILERSRLPVSSQCKGVSHSYSRGKIMTFTTETRDFLDYKFNIKQLMKTFSIFERVLLTNTRNTSWYWTYTLLVIEYRNSRTTR